MPAKPGKRQESKRLNQKNHLKKQAEARMAARRIDVANLLLAGKNYREIATAVGVKSTRTIHEDVKAVLADWREQQQHEISEWVALEIERLGKIESEAWEAWIRSQQDAETRTIKKTSEVPNEETFTLKGQTGDARFLEVVLRCSKQRCELLGLEPPKRLEHTGPDGKPIPIAPQTDFSGMNNAQVQNYVGALGAAALALASRTPGGGTAPGPAGGAPAGGDPEAADA